MYMLVVVLSSMTLNENTDVDFIPSTFFLLGFFLRGGGAVVTVFLSHSSGHMQASSSPSLQSSLPVETVASVWLGAVTALCLVGSSRYLEPTGLRVV